MKRNSYHEIGTLPYKVKKAFERGFGYKFCYTDLNDICIKVSYIPYKR